MNRKTLFFLVLAALVVVLVVAAPAVVRAQNPRATRANITLVFEDSHVRVYEDLDYGARIVVSEGGVAVYCPCGGSCAVATTPPTATPLIPTQGATSTVAPTVAPPTVEPSPTRPPCNQGVGNGQEGCDPGRSNHNQPSNDEGPGCGPGNPCRRR